MSGRLVQFIVSAFCGSLCRPLPAEDPLGFILALCMHALQSFAFLSLLISSGIGQDQECPSSAMDETSRKTFILFGDSLTQKSFDEGGWGARLANAYQRKVIIEHHIVLDLSKRTLVNNDGYSPTEIVATTVA